MLGSAPRSVRTAVWWLFALVIFFGAYLYSPPIGEVTARDLQHSLARALGGDTKLGFECTNVASGLWRCPVHDASVPGSSAVYELKRDGRRCWTANQTYLGRTHLDIHANGCVGLRDQVRLDERF